MANFIPIKGNTTKINETPIKEGQLLINIEDGSIFLDNTALDRIKISKDEYLERYLIVNGGWDYPLPFGEWHYILNPKIKPEDNFNVAKVIVKTVLEDANSTAPMVSGYVEYFDKNNNTIENFSNEARITLDKSDGIVKIYYGLHPDRISPEYEEAILQGFEPFNYDRFAQPFKMFFIMQNPIS